MNATRASALIGALLVAGAAAASSAQAVSPRAASAQTLKAQPSVSPEAAAQAATRAENRRLLSLVRLPAGSTRDKGPQVAILRQPGQHAGTTDLLDQPEFFTLPFPLKEALAYLKSSVPKGLQLTGGGGGSGGGNSYDLLIFNDSRTSTRFTDPTLLYTFAAKGSETALRADAQTIVVHPHSGDEQVGPGAGAATVAASRGYPTTVFRQVTLDRAKTKAIAVALNALPTASAGARSCLADDGGRITVTFAKSAQSFTVNQACYLIGVTVKGAQRPSYNLSQKVEKTLLKDLGLTAKQL